MMASVPAIVDTTPAPLGQLTLLDDVERVMRLPVPEIRGLAVDLIHAGGGDLLRKIKRYAGVVAMALRAKLNDKDYGDWAHDYCGLLGCDPKTLKRWREDAEAARGTTSSHSRKPTSEARKDILSGVSNPPPSAAGDSGPEAEGEAPQPLPSAPGRTKVPAGSASTSASAAGSPALVLGRDPAGSEVGPDSHGAQGEPGDAARDSANETAVRSDPSPEASNKAQEEPFASPSARPSTSGPSRPAGAASPPLDAPPAESLSLPSYPSAEDVAKVVGWLRVRGADYLVKVGLRDLIGLDDEVSQAIERVRKAKGVSTNGTVSESGCEHPKAKRQNKGYAIVCGVCSVPVKA